MPRLRHILFLILTIPCFTLFGQVEEELWFRNLTIDNGLSHNIATIITQDSMGFYWIGTQEGLNRYDGYEIKVYSYNPGDTLSISGNYVDHVYTDRMGRLWLGIRDFGLEQYDYNTDAFIHYYYEDIGLRSSDILEIFQDSKMNMWVATQMGVEVFNPDFQKIKSIPFDEVNLDKNATSSGAIFDIFEDNEGIVWLATYNGLNRYDPETGFISHYFPEGVSNIESNENWLKSIEEGWNRDLWIAGQEGFLVFNKKTGTFRDGFRMLGVEYLNDNRGLNDILIDNDGNIWFAGWEGTSLYNPEKKRINYLNENRNLPYSFPQGSTVDLFLDNIGSIWLGTWNRGVSYHNKEIKKFGLLSKKYNPDGLSGDIVRCVITDNKDNFWIGIDIGGLNYYDRNTGNYIYFLHDDSDPNSLVHDNVRSILLIEENQELWIGTQNGLDVLDISTGNFRHFLSSNDENSLINNDIRFLCRDIYENIWIGTFQGISVFNPSNGVFTNYQHDALYPFSLSDNRVFVIYEDSQRNMWIGTRNGLNKYNPEDASFSHYFTDPADSLSISSNYIISAYEDEKKRLWFGTYGGGLNLFDRSNESFTNYTTNQGLPNNVIYGILEDAGGNLWLSTNKGISKFNPEKETFTNFDRDDGLQSNQFYFNAYHKSNSGELIFGGVKGLNYFFPENIKANNVPPQIVITDFRLFNQTVKPDPNGDASLRKHISMTDSITLKHNQSVISFDFVAIHTGQPQKNKYAFKMEGLEEKWNYVGNTRTATYTNLNAGEYVFKIKASNGNGLWNEKGKSIHLNILPPWWETTLFRVFLGIFVFVIFYLVVLLIRNREKLKTNLRLERIKAEKDRELDAMKLKFYSNISHEFRTPLTLILGPAESLIQGKDYGPESKNQLKIIRKNAQRLLRLINQLLDLSRIESGYMKLTVGQEDIMEFIHNIADSFNYRAKKLNINYSCETNPASYTGWFDRDKVEKILYNLLSNAFKFTNEGGKVTLSSGILNNEPGNEWLSVEISDTGKGIPPENLEKIFDRFFKDEKNKNSGTGIGLTLTRQLIEIHKGKIRCDSEPGKGTSFKVEIPISRNFYTSENFIEPEQKEFQNQVSSEFKDNYEELNIRVKQQNSKSNPVILIIDDNADIRDYITANLNLNKSYTILSADNGKSGYEIIKKSNPNLILCDVMMPEMDGFQLCQLIKSNEETRHIPFLLLTAKTGIENKLKGLEAGADDYIIKPFYIEEISLKINNFLSFHKTASKGNKKVVSLSPSEVEITHPDERFIKKALEIIEKHIDDSEFSIKDFSREIGASRMQLYRKIQAITNQTVKEFIRNIRLERAAQLLQKKAFTINEIAYMVGFREISYFRKCFKEKYGLTPTEYINKSTTSK